MKNKGKETYQNISLPEGLSAAVERGLQRGQQYRRRRLFVTAGSLAAACAAAAVVLLVLPGGGIFRNPDAQKPLTVGIDPETGGQIPAEEGTGGITGEPAGVPDDSFGGYDDDPDFLQDSGEEGPASVAETAGPETASSVQVSGIVTGISDGQIELENTQEAATGQMPAWTLNITESTVFLAADTLEGRSLSDLREGDFLHAYISPNMTRSIPPISNAYVVFLGGDAQTPLPACATITDISSDDSGNLLITLDQDLILIPGEETVIRTVDGKTALQASDLKAGDRILASYQFVTMSIPAQTNPELILLLPETEGL